MPRPEPRPIGFNLFEMNCVGHISHGLWVHPDNTRHRFNELDFWLAEAKLLEEGLFDAVFIADVIGAYDTYLDSLDTSLRESVQIPTNDPLLVIPAMASVTKHLGFAATFSTTYEPPFAFARRASTLDHLTNGRFGWNIVTSYLPNAARNFGLPDEIAHDDRYAIADEFLDVTYKLWEGSWDDDAVVADRERRVYTEPGKVRRINHAGENFRVEGPHLVQPSPQRTPVLFQAGSSPAGKQFAAKHAEGVFVGGHSIESYRENVADLRRLAIEHGRDPYDIRTYAMAVVIVGRTREEAERKAAEFELLSRAEGYLAHFGGIGVDLASFPPETPVRQIVEAERSAGRDRSVQSRFFDTDKTVGEVLRELTRFDRGPFFALGTPEQVADQIEGWVRDTDLDGFNLQQFLTPGTAEDFISLVVPELQKRGLYRTTYEEGTLRERLFGQGNAHLPERHHGARYRGGAHLDGALDLARPLEGALHGAGVGRG